MSMTAAIEALAALEALEDSCEVLMYTDSKYLCDGIANWIKSREKRDWRTKAGKLIKNVGKAPSRMAIVAKTIRWHFHKPLHEQAEAIALAEQGLKEHLPPDHELPTKKW